MRLPYNAKTVTGDRFEIDFPLHEETEDAVKVHQMLTTILETIDEQIKVLGPVGNGDVLQAMAMALAVRARIIHAPAATLREIVTTLVESNLAATLEAERQSPPAGHG